MMSRLPALMLTAVLLTAPARADVVAGNTAPFSGVLVQRINVIGDDDRRTPDSGDDALAQAVGVIACSLPGEDYRRRSFGTGTLVGDSGTVLTAAHVLRDDPPDTTSRLDFDATRHCRFQQYDASGGLRFESGFRRAVYGAFRHNSGLPNEDWAVLVLAEPPPSASRPLPFARLSPEDMSPGTRIPVTVLAFHADLRSRRRQALLSEGEVFSVAYAGFERLAHTADMGRMSSGAALVHRDSDGAVVVVGLHRSAARFDDYNLAVPVSGELAATLNGLTRGLTPEPGRMLAESRGFATVPAAVDGLPPAE